MKNNITVLILFICIALLTVSVALFVLDTVTYAGYVKTEAEIVSVDSQFGNKSDTNMNQSHYVTYEYTVNGEKITAKRQEFSKTGKDAGDIKTVKYAPDSPHTLQNTYSYYTKMGATIFMGVITALLCVIVLRNKRSRG